MSNIRSSGRHAHTSDRVPHGNSLARECVRARGAGGCIFAVRAGAPTTNPVTLVTSQSEGLLSGQAVTLTVNTSGGTTLVGNLTVHLCRHGLTNYGSTNFGYSGLSATRCVYGQGVVSGGIPGADYEQTFGPYAGSENTWDR